MNIASRLWNADIDVPFLFPAVQKWTAFSISKRKENFKSYEKAIEVAKGRSYQYGSIPEAMVAIELLKNKYKIVPQQKIGKYKVDFVIPQIKVVLEVDGKLYHSDIRAEGERDFVIHQSLGIKWMVIHYPAEYVTKDIRT